MAELSTFATCQNILGESPFWYKEPQSVLWVDVEQGILYEQKLHSQSTTTWHVGKNIAVILSAKRDRILLGSQDGIGSFNLTTAAWKLEVPIELEDSTQRCNDGAFDPVGNLWIGSMDVQVKEGLGSLYRIAENRQPLKVLENLTIPNGLVFSLDNKRMYFIDTPTRTVKGYMISSGGDIALDKTAIVIPENMGMPDGMTIDAEGMLWIALYGGAAISRWNPLDGSLLETISIPALHVTSCCFANDDLDELIVTSARENMTEAQLAMYPESGNVFRIRNPGVRGVKMLSHTPSTTFFR
ncbi:MAG: SMP-30/gluconolactonase/LRE family protein [Pedobacter sp.]|nr:MAG: SMP-30/gluconolactonase/LRE family protein [Pedobacter sp.]